MNTVVLHHSTASAVQPEAKEELTMQMLLLSPDLGRWEKPNPVHVFS